MISLIMGSNPEYSKPKPSDSADRTRQERDQIVPKAPQGDPRIPRFAVENDQSLSQRIQRGPSRLNAGPRLSNRKKVKQKPYRRSVAFRFLITFTKYK